MVGINHFYAPFGLCIGQNLSMLYTFWTIHWSKLFIILHLLDYMLVRIDHYDTPFGLYIYWSEIIISTRHISLSFPFFLRAPIYLEPVASEEHKVLKVSKKGNNEINFTLCAYCSQLLTK